jgi:5-dehydro-2-deoxygluconokinase
LTGDIPDSSTTGVSGPGFPIEVFNVLGAGDGFMSGLLKGWLDGEDWETALTYANACGAFAVSPPRLHAGLSELGGTAASF